MTCFGLLADHHQVSSSSSVGPVANATDVLQPIGLLYSPYPPPACLDVPTFAARYPTSTTTREILVAKGGSMWVRINR